MVQLLAIIHFSTFLALEMLTIQSMSRPSLHFLRPYLCRTVKTPNNPEYARVYCAVQQRFAQSVSVDAYTGPHDVEKQKRLDQLQKVRPLETYHPRLVYPAGVENLSVMKFNAQYEKIKDTQSDVVAVFGMR